MKNKKIEIKGISRMLPQSVSDDGLSRDIINLRNWNGAWRPIGNPVQFATGAGEDMPFFIHRVTNGSDFLITYDTATGYIKYKPLLSGANANLEDIGTGKTVRFSSLHNVLLVINETDQEIYYVLYDLTELSYRWIGDRFPDMLHLTFSQATDYEEPDPEINFEIAGNEDYLIDLINSNLTKLEATANEKGLFTGYVNFLYAYELFDGSIVKHSHIRGIKTGEWQFKNSAGPPAKLHTRVMVKKLMYDIVTTDSVLNEIKATYKNIIKSLNIYMTRPYNPYVITEDDLPGTSSYAELPLKDSYGIENIATTTAVFRLIKKITLDELSESTDNEIEFKSLSTIDTLEGLPVDNFSHHKLFGGCEFKYNNRIFHGDVKMSLYKGFDPVIFLRNYGFSDTGPAYKVWFEVEIKDIDGVKTVRSDIAERDQYYTPDATPLPLFFLLNFFYPDSRASALNVYYSDETDVYLIRSVVLSKHPSMNFSYYIGNIEMNGLARVIQSYLYSELPSLNSTILNPNRIQSSEVDNPFYFPAKNSYNIGSSRIVGMGANTLLIDSSQFGEYPLYAFTQDGIWAMNFSADASILIDSIKPAAMDVCTSRDSITPTPFGVVFITEDQLMIIAGMKSVKISTEMEGNHLSFLARNLDYKNITGNANIADVTDYTDAVSFESYLQNAEVSFNFKRNELVISNSTYNYSYLYSNSLKMWYKCSNSYNRIMNYNQKIIGETGGVLYDLTEESFAGDLSVPVLIESYPIKLDIDSFKKIDSMALRGLFSIDQDKGGSLYLFGSIDGLKWFNMLSKDISGDVRDIISKRVDYSACQFVVVFSGSLKEDSYLTHLDFVFKERFGGKMR